MENKADNITLKKYTDGYLCCIGCASCIIENGKPKGCKRKRNCNECDSSKSLALMLYIWRKKVALDIYNKIIEQAQNTDNNAVDIAQIISEYGVTVGEEAKTN